ncbi:MAG: response regulator [Pseudodesulfovibrio sp.]|nr:response regulator [Pseudodesulfovibrio sp.]
MIMNGDILIVDDDAALRELLTEYLEGYGFTVLNLPSGEKAAETVRQKTPCLVILDVMMPGRDGLEVLREIRALSSVPVIMLTAKGEDTDRIVGLELGADDYMPKPFNPRELLARIKAVLRRYENVVAKSEAYTSTSAIEIGGLILNISRHVLIIEGDELELLATEFRLLKALMENPDIALTRDELMNLAWDKDFSAFDRSIDVHISKLRSLLKPYSSHGKRIKTVWGTGYMFVGMS